MATLGQALTAPESTWQRIDDRNTKITYDGFSKLSEPTMYSGTYSEIVNISGSLTFKFYGTKLRIFGSRYPDDKRKNCASVYIDGNLISDISEYNSSYIAQTLEFEILNLALTTHIVQIIIPTNKDFILDAIDIDESGYLCTIVGSQLTNPETGWQRYDDSDGRIVFLGDKSIATDSIYTNSHITYYKVGTSNGKISFKFYGTKLRLIHSKNTDWSNSINVTIDGNTEIYTAYNTNLIQQILTYEKLNLSLGIHTVEITNNTTNAFGLDAIDIDGDLLGTGIQLSAPETGWKRYDDRDSKITYFNIVQESSSLFYNSTGTCVYKNASGNGYGKFKFNGTKVRIICFMDNQGIRDNNIKVTIDDTIIGYFSTRLLSGTQYSYALCYEKVGLDNGIHTVTIEPTTSGCLVELDAVDIDSTGYMIAQVGQQLTAPETGWKRIDNKDTRISYIGSWYTAHSNASFYNGGEYWGNDSNAKVNFTFYGTKLRLIGYADSGGSRSQNYSITIDGVLVYTGAYPTNNIIQCLVGEVLNLSIGIHTVEIKSLDSKIIGLDAIDIDDTGDLLGTGIQLTAPDSGWRRYDDRDSRILKIGSTFGTNTDAGQYGGSSSWISGDSPLTTKFSFKFKGTKLRIMGIKNNNGLTTKISIDGIVDTYSNYNSSIIYQILLYEKIGLTNDVHTVEISLNENGANKQWIWFDSVDIDANGYLVHPILNQVSDILNMNIGDCIPCRYTATTSGTVGTFSEIGTCIANEIPVTGTATPDGLFYLIKVDKGTLIADRTLQSGITWDNLNTNKVIEGKPNVSDETNQSYIIDGGSYSGRNLAFDNKTGAFNVACWEAPNSDGTGWVGQLFPSPKIIKTYSITSSSDYPGNSPKNWTFEGSNDGTNWIILHSVTGATWNSSETKYFSIPNSTAYTRYRINVTKSSGAVYVIIGELEMSSKPMFFTRSLSGGCAFNDGLGNLSTIDKLKGAWPDNNEWDTYIANSTLDGKITPGDNNIWHWNQSIYTWIKETPILTLGSNNYRVQRGFSNNLNYFGSSISSASTNMGFRPLLEYLELDSKSTNLYY